MKPFDKAYWSEVIKRPDWYIEFLDFFKKHEANLEDRELDEFRYTCRKFFEQALQKDEVALASSGPNLDDQRLPLDTVVIHHTSNKPGYRLNYMNAVHLLNIYAPYFIDPTDEREKSLKGAALWSGHFKDGKQVFWGYHWLMKMDGTFERLLEDRQIGWHAGNWEVNRRSVAICLDNDYEKQDPGDDILQKLATHIKENYPNIESQNIIGHCEAKLGTICPGGNFIGGWKAKLLNYIDHDA